jgi:hypothetical protein
MSKFFINCLLDAKYIAIYLCGLLILFFSFEILLNFVLEYLSETVENISLNDLFLNSFFPIALNYTSSLLFSIARELISLIIILYPLVKVIDMFLNYLSSILFTKIKRKNWVKALFILIIIYTFITCLLLIIIDLIGFYLETGETISIKVMIFSFIVRYFMTLSIFSLFMYFAIKMEGLYFGVIFSLSIYIIYSIFINNIFLTLNRIYFIPFLLINIGLQYLFYITNTLNIEKKDIGGL